ncbi:aromatic amino acid hydroxylase [Bacillus sp. EB106-08-02-XG196]|jgi:phenylalanine-4-hydroxylase|uniref:aromatic amino acid hydroxylase n=1 Tax=Bacillus sp. EB106-08-02-XG196 TaxID=2737049 RepID=UPI0015C4DA5A|nr:aromatic amino acid hydroxylase [Bacillus sp. EB106-08-02-XG196]NWQ43767.1 aromatic amino acid hydroxylase [Bacillus sp. EB106-08-02-XG196]
MGEVKKVPRHLQKYVVDQQYEKYTPIDHAVWRYVMRQNHNYLKDTAHQAYVGGLKASGISVEKIPNVMDMNKALKPFGWGAANIDGFIPGVIFFDFQAHGILPIASDIRKLENIQYTPAPDIIHEAAGHAPILCEEKFSEYVKLFGQIGSKALATSEEHELFEAVRTYSNLLESGKATKEEIKEAKANFEEKQSAVTELSEAEQISRLYWWTVEYGLIGSVNQPQIYGAGLLSSVSEGRSSLTASVKKLPFNLQHVIETGFDITKPQPQLFVCDSFDQLIDAVNKFSETMAFKVGGTEGLEKALRSNHTATIQYSSGLQLTGTLRNIIKDEKGEAIYIQTEGPSALAYNNTELKGHGKTTHHDGFGAPIGGIVNVIKPLEKLTDAELGEIGIEIGKDCTLEYESGVKVVGAPVHWIRKEDNLLLISFRDCKVSFADQTLFQPEWGTYDLAVGEKISSVFAGAADSDQFYVGLEEVEKKPQAKRELSQLEQLYGKVRNIRENAVPDIEVVLTEVIEKLTKDYQEDWLLRIEVMELLVKNNLLPDKQLLLKEQLEEIKLIHDEYPVLIERGLMLTKVMTE